MGLPRKYIFNIVALDSQIIYQPNFCRQIGLALMEAPCMMHMASHRTAEFTTSLRTRGEVASYMMSTWPSSHGVATLTGQWPPALFSGACLKHIASKVLFGPQSIVGGSSWGSSVSETP